MSVGKAAQPSAGAEIPPATLWFSPHPDGIITTSNPPLGRGPEPPLTSCHLLLKALVLMLIPGITFMIWGEVFNLFMLQTLFDFFGRLAETCVVD